MSEFCISTQEAEGLFFDFDRRFYRSEFSLPLRSSSGYVVFEGRGYPIDALATRLEISGHHGGNLKEQFRGLGFRLLANENWTEGEIALSCALRHRMGWDRTLRASDPTVQEFSRYLRELSPLHRLIPNHPSTSSIQRKLDDIRTSRRDYHLRETRGGALTVRVAHLYDTDPRKVLRMARSAATANVPEQINFLLD